jgi:hypothetical protein
MIRTLFGLVEVLKAMLLLFIKVSFFLQSVFIEVNQAFFASSNNIHLYKY